VVRWSGKALNKLYIVQPGITMNNKKINAIVPRTNLNTDISISQNMFTSAPYLGKDLWIRRLARGLMGPTSLGHACQWAMPFSWPLPQAGGKDFFAIAIFVDDLDTPSSAPTNENVLGGKPKSTVDCIPRIDSINIA
jgi:hypothetical protein